MPVDAYGYEAKTVLDTIEELTAILEKWPQMANEPVYIDAGTMFVPVKKFSLRPPSRGPGQMRLIVETHP